MYLLVILPDLFFLNFSGLGPAWSLAIVNSEEELMKLNNLGSGDAELGRIGGSTNEIGPFTSLDIYFPNNSGCLSNS